VVLLTHENGQLIQMIRRYLITVLPWVDGGGAGGGAVLLTQDNGELIQMIRCYLITVLPRVGGGELGGGGVRGEGCCRHKTTVNPFR